MEENKKEEEKIEAKDDKVKTKRKGMPRIIYWLIVIVGLTFIYFMSYRIGQRIAEKSNEGSNDKDISEKSNSNNTSNLDSNNTSNSNSNVTSNETSNETTNNSAYSIKDFVGTFVSEEESRSYQFSSQATFLSSIYGVAGCGKGSLGYFVIEDNKMYMYPLIGTECENKDWSLLQENAAVATIISKDEFQINGKSYKRKDNTSLNEIDTGLRYGISILESKGKNE